MNPQAQQFQPTYPVNDPTHGCQCPNCSGPQQHLAGSMMGDVEMDDDSEMMQEHPGGFMPFHDGQSFEHPGMGMPMHPGSMMDQDIEMNFNFGPNYNMNMGGHPGMGMPMHGAPDMHPGMGMEDMHEEMPGMEESPHMFMPGDVEAGDEGMHHGPMMGGHPGMGMPMHGAPDMHPGMGMEDMPMGHGFPQGGFEGPNMHPGFDNQMLHPQPHPQQFGHPFPHGSGMSGPTKSFSRS